MKLTIFAITIAAFFSLSAQERPLEMYWIDVEGGAATLIVTPAGESILIDAGMDLERDVSRIADVVQKQAGLTRIDHFVATHWHADHYGGVSKLNQRVPLKRFYDHGDIPKDLSEDPTFPQLIKLYLKVTGGKSKALQPGDVIPVKQISEAQPLKILCIASDRKVGGNASGAKNPACAGRKPSPRDTTDNANSVVLKLTYGKFTFFDGGDLTRDVEEELVCPTNRVGTVDLYQSDAHGMLDGNSAVFVHSIRPRVVVVNNGPEKGAAPDSMKGIFSSPGLETVWQLHRNLKSSKELNTKPEFIANEAERCSAQFVKATVRPDGAFTLQVGANGAKKTYAAR